MENTFVKVLDSNRAPIIEELKSADLLAMDDPQCRYLVFVFDDGDPRTLRAPADDKEPDLSNLPCVLVGSFCYLGSTLSKAEREDLARTRDYNAMIDNCITVLHHYR